MAQRSANDFLDPLDPEAFAEAARHPVRGRIMAAVAERPDVTIQEVADRLGESPRRIRHHLEILLDLGLVEVTGEEARRGVIQRRYGKEWLGIDDVDSLNIETRVELAKVTVRFLLADISVAAAAGVLGKRLDDFEVRVYGEVDEACLEDLAEIHARVCREIRKTVVEGRERVKQSGESGTEIVSALFFFEAPLWHRSSNGA